jgi:hypothetical protein
MGRGGQYKLFLRDSLESKQRQLRDHHLLLHATGKLSFLSDWSLLLRESVSLDLLCHFSSRGLRAKRQLLNVEWVLVQTLEKPGALP